MCLYIYWVWREYGIKYPIDWSSLAVLAVEINPILAIPRYTGHPESQMYPGIHKEKHGQPSTLTTMFQKSLCWRMQSWGNTKSHPEKKVKRKEKENIKETKPDKSKSQKIGLWFPFLFFFSFIFSLSCYYVKILKIPGKHFTSNTISASCPQNSLFLSVSVLNSVEEHTGICIDKCNAGLYPSEMVSLKIYYNRLENLYYRLFNRN